MSFDATFPHGGLQPGGPPRSVRMASHSTSDNTTLEHGRASGFSLGLSRLLVKGRIRSVTISSEHLDAVCGISITYLFLILLVAMAASHLTLTYFAAAECPATSNSSALPDAVSLAVQNSFSLPVYVLQKLRLSLREKDMHAADLLPELQATATALQTLPHWNQTSIAVYTPSGSMNWSYSSVVSRGTTQLWALASDPTDYKMTPNVSAQDMEYLNNQLQHLRGAQLTGATWGEMQIQEGTAELPMYLPVMADEAVAGIAALHVPLSVLREIASSPVCKEYHVTFATPQHGVVVHPDGLARDDVDGAWERIYEAYQSHPSKGSCTECYGENDLWWKLVRIEEGLDLIAFGMTTLDSGNEHVLLYMVLNGVVSLVLCTATFLVVVRIRVHISHVRAIIADLICMRFSSEPPEGSFISELHDALTGMYLLTQSMSRFAAFVPTSVLRENQTLVNHCGGNSVRSDIIRRLSSASDMPTINQMARSFYKSMERKQELQSRPVTLIYVNLRGTLRLIDVLDQTELLLLHGDFVTQWLSRVEDHGGIAEQFSGDRMLASFNAVQPCLRHSYKACLASTAIVNGEGTDNNRVTVGIAASDALMGVMGSGTIKQYTILSRAFPLAVLLERLCLLYPCDVLTHLRVTEECPLVYFKMVDWIHVPSLARKGSAVIPVTTVFSTVSSTDAEEWMYEMDRNEANSPVTAYNEAISLAKEAKWEEAHSAAANITDDDRLTARLHDIIRNHTTSTPNTETPPATSFFFANGVPGSLGPLVT
eukprot:Sspe_Gene.20090::Locus_7345_Transcript_1_1_Confidence_1.000_Length_2694::g.20090::m.20090